MNEVRLFGMLGFAMRAGKLVIGTEQVLRTIAKARHGIKLILVSEQASEATKKKIKSKSEFYSVQSVSAEITQESLGDAIGKTYAPACVGVADEGFAKAILEAIKIQ